MECSHRYLKKHKLSKLIPDHTRSQGYSLESTCPNPKTKMTKRKRKNKSKNPLKEKRMNYPLNLLSGQMNPRNQLQLHLI